MHGSENVKYAFVGFFTKSNKQWSSSMYVFPHKMEKTNVLYPPKKLDSQFPSLSINYIHVYSFTYLFQRNVNFFYHKTIHWGLHRGSHGQQQVIKLKTIGISLTILGFQSFANEGQSLLRYHAEMIFNSIRVFRSTPLPPY